MSLVTRVFMLVTVTLLLVAGGELFNGLNLRREWVGEVRGDTAELARIAELDMVRILAGTQQLLASFAKLPADHGWDERACSALQAAASGDLEYDHLVAVDRGGIIRCSSSGPKFIGAGMPDRELFDRIVATGAFSVGSYGVDRSSGNEVIRVGYPVIDTAGAVVGAVYAGINLTWLNTAISQWQLGETASIDITDRNGTLIARHPEPRYVGQPLPDHLKPFLSAANIGAAEVRGADGVVRLYGYVPVLAGPSDAIAVFVGRDRERIFADIDRSIWLNAAVALLGLLSAAAFAVIYVGRFLSRPFQRLLTTAALWRDGDWSARAGAASGIPEFDRLSLAFDGMAAEVSARDRALQFANTLLVTMKDMSPDAILVVDPDHQIISFNAQFVEMWSLPPGLIAAGDDDAVMAAVASSVQNPEAFVARVQYLYKHPEDSAQDEVATTDGRILDRHTAALHTAAGGYLGRVWFFRDITARKRAERRVSEMARSDALTGLPNRRAFDDDIEQEIVRSRRYDRPLSVAIVDIDHFKAVNDRFGHLSGDVVLKSLADFMRKDLRNVDYLARWGGEEFVVLLPETPLDVAESLLNRLRTDIANYTIPEIGRAVTLSVGVTACMSSDDRGELLERADRALYISKHTGRNKVTKLQRSAAEVHTAPVSTQ